MYKDRTRKGRREVYFMEDRNIMEQDRNIMEQDTNTNQDLNMVCVVQRSVFKNVIIPKLFFKNEFMHIYAVKRIHGQ